jgi:hypothetical protein
MSEIDYPKLFQTCVLLCAFKGVKTIDPKIIQYAFKILYLDTHLIKTAQSNASKYISYYMSTEGCIVSEFKKASKLKKSLKNYLDTNGQKIYNCDYRISSTVGIYLCGLDDVFDNTHKTQFSSLGKKNTEKSCNSSDKKQEPIPEDHNEDLIENNNDVIDLDVEDEEDDEDDGDDGDDGDDKDEVKLKSKIKTKSVNI